MVLNCKGRINKRAVNNPNSINVTLHFHMPALLKGLEWSGDSPSARIRKTRISHSLTIRELAFRSNMSPETISYLESGTVSPSFPTLCKLSSALDVPIWYLGCFELLPKNNLGEKIFKARHYHGMIRKEFAKKLE